jgi:hypothetical protein
MSNTLEKMQAAGIADDDTGTTDPLPESGELVLEDDLDPDAVVADGEGEGTMVLAGDDQDHHRVEVPKKTLSQLRRTRREARDDAAQQHSENDDLRAELQALKKATLKKPSYVDFTTDADFEAALLEYHAIAGDSQAAPAPSRRVAAAPAARAQPAQGPDFSEDVNAHIDRAEALGVDLTKFAQAERAVRTTMGDMVTDAIISAVGPGSEKAVMILGSRPAELAKVQQLLAEDPTGLRVVSHLTRLASKATVRKKTISDAPRATRSPQGDGQQVAAAAGPYEKRLAKADKTGDVQAMVKIRREARQAGVKL